MTTRAQWLAMKDPSCREHFIYFAYDAQGLLLYVGCTMQPALRLKGHEANNAPWLEYVVRYRALGPYNYDTARRMERDAINEYQPPFNTDTRDWVIWRKRNGALSEHLVQQHMATGKSLNQAVVLAVSEANRIMPRPESYRPLVSA